MATTTRLKQTVSKSNSIQLPALVTSTIKKVTGLITEIVKHSHNQKVKDHPLLSPL